MMMRTSTFSSRILCSLFLNSSQTQTSKPSHHNEQLPPILTRTPMVLVTHTLKRKVPLVDLGELPPRFLQFSAVREVLHRQSRVFPFAFFVVLLLPACVLFVRSRSCCCCGAAVLSGRRFGFGFTAVGLRGGFRFSSCAVAGSGGGGGFLLAAFCVCGGFGLSAGSAVAKGIFVLVVSGIGRSESCSIVVLVV